MRSLFVRLFSIIFLCYFSSQSYAQSCGSGGGATVCLSATGTADAINLSWTVSGTIDSIQIYRDTDSNPSGRSRIASVRVGTTSFSDTTAAVGTQYWYWIKFRAQNKLYNSGAASATRLSSSSSSSSSSQSVSSSSSSSSQSSAMNAPLPTPTYGFNLGNSLEAIWGYAYPSQAVFTTAANAGFNAVRIPCAWDSNANQATYKIDPAYMAKVKQAVDYAIAAGMYVVINDHWDGGWLENNIGSTVDSTIDAKMNSYWTQIATTFAGYDNHLLFAGANEPNVHNPAEWETLKVYYETFINAVRGVGQGNTNRWLVLQGPELAWFNGLPADSTPNRLMVEYHNYTPSLFTIIHSDQSWGNAIYFWGEAYHYAGNPSRNSPKAWEEGIIDSGFQQLNDMFVSKGIPVMIGEFQAAGTGGLTGNDAAYNRASVVYWNKYLVDSAHGHGLSPFYWSTPNSPFEYSAGTITDADVVNVLTGGKALPPLTGAPDAATNLVASNGSAGAINLSWSAAANATSYKVYRAAESGYESEIAPVATGITSTSFTDTGLNEGTTYYYQVVAVNSSGPSGFSPEAKATTPGINPDPAKYNFETDPQRFAVSWVASGTSFSVATSGNQHYAGNQSLAVNFSGGTGGSSGLSLSDVVISAGATVTFHVWIPANSTVTAVDLYLQDYNWNWFDTPYQNLTANAWNTITLTVPAGATAPLKRLGIQFTTSAAWTGTLYIDSIDWQ